MAEFNVPMPAITIIAPMYNVERFIAPCLDSVLSQTFEDYELIVVDDCSTDRSSEIAQTYVERFNGRMRLIKMKKNTGGAALPRNTGIRLSRGKYLAFLDTDDLFVDTALADLYNAAVETNADVVHTERYFTTGPDALDNHSELQIKTSEQPGKVGFVDKITVETHDLGQRMNMYVNGRFFWFPWGKLFRRDLVVENNIEFPNWPTADDTIFCFKCLCLAKNYVRIPNLTNVYRTNPESLTNKTLDVPKYIHRWVNIIVEGTRIIDEFMSGIDLFDKQPAYKFSVINFFVQEKMNWINRAYIGRNMQDFDRLFRAEFKGGDNHVLTAYLFNMMLSYRLRLAQTRKAVADLKKGSADQKSV